MPGVRSGPNDLQNYPVLVTAIAGSTSGAVQGTLNSVPTTTFLIEFFTNQIPDPSGFGQGQTPIGSKRVTTDGQGNASFSFSPTSGLSANTWVTATATNLATGDTSEFSNAISALPVSVQFLTSTIAVDATAGTTLVHVQRVGNGNAIVSVHYATADGTAIAGKDYTAASGTLTFQPGEIDKTFAITILVNPAQKASSTTVNMALSQPTGGATLGSISTAVLTINQNLPPILQFSASTYSTYSTSRSVLVTVTRGAGAAAARSRSTTRPRAGRPWPGRITPPCRARSTFLPNQMTRDVLDPDRGGKPGRGHEDGRAEPRQSRRRRPGRHAEHGDRHDHRPSRSIPSGPVDTVPPEVTGTQLVLGPAGSPASRSRSASRIDPDASPRPGELRLLSRSPRAPTGRSGPRTTGRSRWPASSRTPG